MKNLLKFFCVFTIILLAGTLIAKEVWVPPEINATKGDIVLSGTPETSGVNGSMISDILAVLGCWWSHSGIVVDDGATMRHNTMYMDEIEQLTNGCGIPYMLNPDQLSNGMPGILSEDMETAFNGEKAIFHVAGSVILKPSAANEAAYRPFLETVADTLIGLAAYYRVYAYTNFFQMDNVDYYIKGRGNHCSGTCWYANYFAGKQMNTPLITNDLIQEATLALYANVKGEVEDQVGCGKLFAPDVAEDIANQVVNTFAFDRADDLSPYWRTHLDGVTSEAVAPDHLLMNTYSNPYGNNSGLQTPATSYYDQVDPIEWTDGYWTTVPDDDDSSGCGS